ncbi:EXO1 [Enterospora canceri]|uniref:EXO1 n=1 Tax=Enterospora canceri TaxID=1081671 RepID=A0A1Y1S3W1_9MICR|nr:EXO1 [Enterospora canceri]
MVRKAIRRVPISEYRKKRVSVDAFCWIHAIASNCAYEIYNKLDTKKYINMFRNKINSLTKHGIVPIFVFDGDLIVAKQETSENRQNIRDKARVEMEMAIEEGDSHRARELVKRAIKIESWLVYEFLQELEKQDIEYIIAPYEADAQMAYLNRIGYVDHVMTEDSDLIVYGATSILFKFNGALLTESLGSFFADNLMEICILSGCDYLSSIKGIGLKKALKFYEKHGSVEELVKELQYKMDVPEGYIHRFHRAKLTFMHHIVYDPITKERKNYTHTDEDYEWLGSKEAKKHSMEPTCDAGYEVEVERHFHPGIDLQSIENRKNTVKKDEYAGCQGNVTIITVDSEEGYDILHSKL